VRQGILYCYKPNSVKANLVEFKLELIFARKIIAMYAVMIKSVNSNKYKETCVLKNARKLPHLKLHLKIPKNYGNNVF
jgi:hypothetical protein